jgi:ATP-dependent Clp protease adaptor protein ClpS
MLRLEYEAMDRQDTDTHSDDGLAVQASRPKLKKPPMYKVLLLNDDFTPMEFVVHILERFFTMDRAKATRIMLNVHTQGKGLCGTFVRDIAETKVAQVNEYARSNHHPLLCTMESV